MSGAAPASGLALGGHGEINQRFAYLVGRLHQIPADSVDGRLGDADSRANGLLGHSSLAETLDGG